MLNKNLLAVVKTMKLSEISAETLEKIKSVRWDRIIEKHEGPESWESVLRYEEPEFLLVEDCSILLPVDKSHHPNITLKEAEGRRQEAGGVIQKWIRPRVLTLGVLR